MSIFGNWKKKEQQDHDAPEDSARQEMLNEEKQDMIRGVEDLSTTSVKEVMIPRIDVDFIESDITGDELISRIISSGHSRFPVYENSIDNVTGVLYVKDLLRYVYEHQEFDIQKIIRKAYFVPESKRIDSLLREFKRHHLHIAVAIDEYGGVSGIVTMEDIIEEIVGDIQDEFDKEREDILVIGENVWLCDARVNLDELNGSIGAAFPDEDYDSLGGFVFDLFGKIPAKYEKVSWNGYDFIVQDVEGHRINMIKVIRTAPSGDSGSDVE